MKHRKLIIGLGISLLMIPLLIQCFALIKCEVLTNRYYSDFEFAYKDNPMMGEMESFKVLECDGQNARVYYIENGKIMAHVLNFEKVEGNWRETSWGCIWSTIGSASGVTWPYWWHFIYGGF